MLSQMAVVVPVVTPETMVGLPTKPSAMVQIPVLGKRGCSLVLLVEWQVLSWAYQGLLLAAAQVRPPPCHSADWWPATPAPAEPLLRQEAQQATHGLGTTDRAVRAETRTHLLVDGLVPTSRSLHSTDPPAVSMRSRWALHPPTFEALPQSAMS